MDTDKYYGTMGICGYDPSGLGYEPVAGSCYKVMGSQVLKDAVHFLTDVQLVYREVPAACS